MKAHNDTTKKIEETSNIPLPNATQQNDKGVDKLIKIENYVFPFFKAIWSMVKTLIITALVISVIAVGLCLTFHVVETNKGIDVFPKENLTFDNTFITYDDINAIIKRFNNASVMEQMSIKNEPLVRKLREKGYIVDNDKKDKQDYREDIFDDII